MHSVTLFVLGLLAQAANEADCEGLVDTAALLPVWVGFQDAAMDVGWDSGWVGP